MKWILLILSNFIYGQNPAGIWYFGDNAGVSFNSGNIPVNLTNGQLDTYEGCATLCDVSGNLLFYTDGTKIWNKNHTVMPDGEGLLGNSSSTQSAIIVPKPNSNNLYYVFTVDYLGNSNGLNYNIIDINLDNGLGDIISKNNFLTSPTLEKISVVKHANNVNYWIISHKYNSNEFICYELTPSGINTPIVSNVGVTISGPTRTVGYLKSSPNGEFVACANSETSSSLQLFKFNNLTGYLTLISTSGLSSSPIGAYGVEFSPNSKLLYVTKINTDNNSSQIYQYNIESLNEATINSSRTLISDYANPLRKGLYGGLQLAPNQKIYVARNDYAFLGVINSPNILGIGCMFNQDDIDLSPNKSYYGLPSFITSLFNINFTSSNFCLGNQTQFNTPNFDVVLSTSWNFGDFASPNNTSILPNPTHVFTSTGTYIVTLTVQTATGINTFSEEIKIVNSPIAYQPADYVLCIENSATDVFTLSTKDDEILANQDSNDYSISYHLSQLDASNNSNPVSIISNPQTIYARIQPIIGGTCYDVTSFQLIKNSKPVLEIDSNIAYCVKNYPDLITLSAGNLISNEILTYLWNNGEETETIQVNQANVYSVTATNTLGCQSIRTINVYNSDIASINFSIQGDFGNNYLVINSTGIGNYVYSLDDINGYYQTSPIFDNLTPGNHMVYVKDINGCGIVFDHFFILGFPKYFTPNNDGINDNWGLINDFKDYTSLSIFDRYGKLIAFLTPDSPNWDGTNFGKKIPSSDYWFKLVLKNGKIETGHFTLKR